MAYQTLVESSSANPVPLHSSRKYLENLDIIIVSKLELRISSRKTGYGFRAESPLQGLNFTRGWDVCHFVRSLDLHPALNLDETLIAAGISLGGVSGFLSGAIGISLSVRGKN